MKNRATSSQSLLHCQAICFIFFKQPCLCICVCVTRSLLVMTRQFPPIIKQLKTSDTTLRQIAWSALASQTIPAARNKLLAFIEPLLTQQHKDIIHFLSVFCRLAIQTHFSPRPLKFRVHILKSLWVEAFVFQLI